jgi:hypothetical protein
MSNKKINLFAKKILMIEPTNFGTNTETLADNKFMKESSNDDQPKAYEEFNNFVNNLRNKHIEVLTYKQPFLEAKDAIFPNNWFSTHRNENFPDGLLIIYPMKNKSRRIEKNPEIIGKLKSEYKEFLDLSYLEMENEFIESTGSLIFDNQNQNIYCSMSERSTEKALDIFILAFNKLSKTPYNLIKFNSKDINGNTIYHTNVVLSVLEKHIVVCLDSIVNKEERKNIVSIISNSNKKILEITMKEMQNFGCNIINATSKDSTVLIISKTAYENLSEEKIDELKSHYDLCINMIDNIENVGGGSCRCMVAEIF